LVLLLVDNIGYFSIGKVNKNFSILIPQRQFFQ